MHYLMMSGFGQTYLHSNSHYFAFDRMWTYKHTNINIIITKLIFVLIHDVRIDFGRCLLVINNPLSFERKVLYSLPIASCILNVSGVKLTCSSPKILTVFSFLAHSLQNTTWQYYIGVANRWRQTLLSNSWSRSFMH